MSRRDAIGSLGLRPGLAPGDVRRVASAEPLWRPCADGCCLVVVAPASGPALKESLRRLMSSALGLAGVREVDGVVAVQHGEALVLLTVSGNRISHRVAARPAGPGHPAVARPRAGQDALGGSEGGGRVVSLFR